MCPRCCSKSLESLDSGLGLYRCLNCELVFSYKDYVLIPDRVSPLSPSEQKWMDYALDPEKWL